jgi:hypothetical protein
MVDHKLAHDDQITYLFLVIFKLKSALICAHGDYAKQRKNGKIDLSQLFLDQNQKI